MNLKDRKKKLIYEYKEDDCKLLKIFENDEKRKKYLLDLAESLKRILKEYSQVKKDINTFKEIPLLYGLISIALEGSIRLYFLSKQFEDFIVIESTKRTLGNLKEKINKTILNEIREKLDYLIFVRNHFVHFPLYYTSFHNDERIFFEVIRFFVEKSGFSEIIPQKLFESEKSDSYEQN